MAPIDYIHARNQKLQQRVVIDDQPYMPFLFVADNSSVTSNGTNAVVAKTTTATNDDNVVMNDTNNNNNDVSMIYDSVKHVVIEMFDLMKKVSSSSSSSKIITEMMLKEKFNVCTVSGGITNRLYCVSGIYSSVISLTDENNNNNNNNITTIPESILVRVFGAEHMIDRDIENSVYAKLAGPQYDIAPKYFGRFGNGRLEEWLGDTMRSLAVEELSSNVTISNEIAINLGQFHSKLFNFQVPTKTFDNDENMNNDSNNDTTTTNTSSSTVTSNDNISQPNLWNELQLWLDLALKTSSFPDYHNQERAKHVLHELVPQLQEEIKALERKLLDGSHPPPRIGFCHNDILNGNILWDDQSESIQFIDFEYGGSNYLSFDIANHFNEFAGGTDVTSTNTLPPGCPNYAWLPTKDRQREFVTYYLQGFHNDQKQRQNKKSCTISSNDNKANIEENKNDSDIATEEVDLLLNEISLFLLVNHLYWGLWAVSQAATEGCNEFDYLLYGYNRISKYFTDKGEGATTTQIIA